MQFGDETNRHLARKEIEITGRRYCTSCQNHQHPDGGKERVTGRNVRRWVCAACLTRRREGIIVRMK